jgi:hypothetical protein
VVRRDDGGDMYSKAPRFEGVADEEHEYGGGGPGCEVVGLSRGAVEMVSPGAVPLW